MNMKKILASCMAIFFLLAAMGCADNTETVEVRITTDPPGASLSINGKEVGNTPFEASVKDLGLEDYMGKEVEVTISAPHAKDHTQRVMLSRTDGIFLAVTLFPSGKVLPGYTGILDPHRKLTLKEVLLLDRKRLGFYRNEIFARYGRPFKTKKYRDYFLSTNWYKVNPDYQQSMLDDVDTYNVNLFLSVERPALTAQEMKRKILARTEFYYGDDTFAFSDNKTLLWFKQDDEAGFYGESTSVTMGWAVAGNWVLAGAKNSPDESKVALRLDLSTGHVLELVTLTSIGYSDWKKIMAASD